MHLCVLRTKALVLELLAAVCLVRGGHDIILSAFDNFKEVVTLSVSYTQTMCWSCFLFLFQTCLNLAVSLTSIRCKQNICKHGPVTAELLL